MQIGQEGGGLHTCIGTGQVDDGCVEHGRRAGRTARLFHHDQDVLQSSARRIGSQSRASLLSQNTPNASEIGRSCSESLCFVGGPMPLQQAANGVAQHRALVVTGQAEPPRRPNVIRFYLVGPITSTYLDIAISIALW